MKMAELERLLVAAERGELSAEDRRRLNDAVRSDDAVLDAVVGQLEIEALLRWHHGAVRGDTVSEARRVFRWAWFAAAAALLLGAALVFRASRSVELDPNWFVVATGGAADFEPVTRNHIELRRGELHVRSASTAAQELVIDTPSGRAVASGTSFYIGAHTGTEEQEMNTTLTRVLVLTGTVTLSNALGTASAAAGGLLVAPQGDPPHEVVARANTEFGFDLYRQLVASGEYGDVFLSPYSIANALAMVAEGARGRTAAEIAAVLRLAPGAARIGDDPQRVPLEWGKIHSGFQRLNRLFDETTRVSEVERVAAEIERLMGVQRQARDAMDRARTAGDREARRTATQEFRRVRDELEAKRRALKTYELRIANSIWGERSYEFDSSFIETISNAYDTGAFVEADFLGDPSGETERINAWVADTTHDRIQDLFADGDLTADTRLVLLNAIWFAGEWTTPFDPGKTSVREFTTLEGAVKRVPMMIEPEHEDVRLSAFRGDGSEFDVPKSRRTAAEGGEYPDADGFLVLEIPYRGEDLAMVIVLPMRDDGLPLVERRLSADNLAKWVAALEQRTVAVELPKFRAESSIDLEPHLAALGMPNAFDRMRADFTGMSTTQAFEDQLFLAKALHKSFVEVHEKGTEAAAATGMALAVRGAVRPFVPKFSADHPFVYLIRDTRTGTVLFLGREVDG